MKLEYTIECLNEIETEIKKIIESEEWAVTKYYIDNLYIVEEPLTCNIIIKSNVPLTEDTDIKNIGVSISNIFEDTTKVVMIGKNRQTGMIDSLVSEIKPI